jgi:hypothetical protein
MLSLVLLATATRLRTALMCNCCGQVVRLLKELSEIIQIRERQEQLCVSNFTRVVYCCTVVVIVVGASADTLIQPI